MSNIVKTLIDKDILTSVIFVIGAILVLIMLWYLGKKKQVKQIILALVIKAEEQFGAGTGDVKYSFVVESAYPLLPKVVRWLITERELGNMIEECVQALEKMLKENALEQLSDKIEPKN